MNVKKVNLGRLGYGTKNIRENEILKKCLDVVSNCKYDFIDCSWTFGNEAMIGISIKTIEEEQKDKNKKIDLPIQSKISHKQYKQGVNKSLRLCLNKLGELEEIDCYFLESVGYDFYLTFEMWKQLISCKKLNKTKKIGLCNFDKDLIKELHKSTNFLPDYCQYELSVSNMRHDRITFCKENNIAIQAFGVLGNLEKHLNNSTLKKIAAEYKCTIPQLLIAYLLNQGIDVVIGSTNEKHIKENAKSKKIILESKTIKELHKLNRYDNLYPELVEVTLEALENHKKTLKPKKN